MQLWPRIAVIWLLSVLVLGACGTAQPQPSADSSDIDTPVSVETSAPAAQSGEERDAPFAEGVKVAGLDIGGMTPDEAATALQDELESLQRPLTLRAGQDRLIIEPTDIDLELPSSDELLAEVYDQADQDSVNIALQPDFAEDVLREQIDDFAEEIALPSTMQLITATDSISRSFTYTPRRTIDIDAAIHQITRRLSTPDESRQIRLSLRADTTAPAPVGLDQIEEQVRIMAESWEGVVGFYLYDLQSNETVALNADTVFSGASVMKVPIMLQSYVKIARFDEDEEQWMQEMIVDSNNLSANDLLSASVGGQGTDDALVGAKDMNELLRMLDLEHTYQNMPYEAGDYLINVRGISIERGPPQEGSPPYTDADPVVRTTPAEMSRIFVLIDQCSRDEGELLELFDDTLSPERCREMLDWLAQNADDTRMRSGLPSDVHVENKSGWVEDMQADVGIVRSPGGDFVLAVYLYQESEWLRDHIAAPVIGDFARMVYTAYNPVEIDSDQDTFAQQQSSVDRSAINAAPDTTEGVE